MPFRVDFARIGVSYANQLFCLAKYDVHDCHGVGYAYRFILVHVGSLHVVVRRVLTKDDVHERHHVGNANRSLVVHVAHQHLGEDDGFERTVGEILLLTKMFLLFLIYLEGYKRRFPIIRIIKQN